jgi:hypothetical protein
MMIYALFKKQAFWAVIYQNESQLYVNSNANMSIIGGESYNQQKNSK